MEKALIIMIKNPVKGKVKTRLAKDIGDEKALSVYYELLKHTNAVAKEIDADRYIFYSDDVNRNDLFENNLFKKYVQCNGDLGVRMDYAFSIPFKNEFKKAVMVGSDCFDIKPDHINRAFDELDAHDFVIGPAQDGGYYLIGMKKWNRWILQNKSWSTDQLFLETKTEIQSKNAKLFELEKLNDVDQVDDLSRYPLLLEMI